MDTGGGVAGWWSEEIQCGGGVVVDEEQIDGKR